MTSQKTLAPLSLNEMAQTILQKRYLAKDAQGRAIETSEDLFWRVAQTIAAIDTTYGTSPSQVAATAAQFYHLMAQCYFQPNSPTLMNAGRQKGVLSACFVLPIEDDLSSIYETMKHAALVHQGGGGTGFAFSNLRPKGDLVRSTMGVASGPVSFMEVYNHSTEAIKQGGTRRGANMGILHVTHPDILDFIVCKRDITKFTNFNISVALTDDFMHAVERDAMYDLINPRTKQVQLTNKEGLKHPLTGQLLVKPGKPARLKARVVFDLIVECAHATGEPGLFFIDRANAFNPVPHLGAYVATNPCGEQPILPYDSCNLGSINLSKFVTPDGKIDWPQLGDVVALSVHFLDNVIDANHYPIEQIADLNQRIRRIGLGIMGWADLLLQLNVPYNSLEALDLARQVMRFVDEEAKKASEQLSYERGTFPEWERSIWGPAETCARKPDGSRLVPERRLRNCNLTTVAPTGTISMIAGCSSGIEPLFAVAFWRQQAEIRMLDINPAFVSKAQVEGWDNQKLLERIADTGHIQHEGVPEETQRVWVTAHEISPEWHVRMQAAFQESTDAAISKTINLPRNATLDEVREAYHLAFELGCKGITVYRDGSRDNQVFSAGLANSTASNGQKKVRKTEISPEKVPEDGLHGCSYPVNTPLGKLRLFVTEKDNRPFEVFAVIGRAGSDVMAFTEALGRLLSLGLRCGIPVKLLAKQLRGIRGSQSVGLGPQRVLSVPDAIGKVLQEHYVKDKPRENGHIPTNQNGNGHNEHNDHNNEDMVTTFRALLETSEELLKSENRPISGEICPECHNATFLNIEGCRKCSACGYSEC